MMKKTAAEQANQTESSVSRSKRRAAESVAPDESSPQRILAELCRIAFGDLRELLDWDREEITLKDSVRLTPAQAATVNEVVKTASGGALKLKRHDKLKALELLMRHHGLLNDKLNLSGEINVSALEKGRARAKQDL